MDHVFEQFSIDDERLLILVIGNIYEDCSNVQARMGSTRLPGKVLSEICGSSMIVILLKRLRKAKKLDQIVLATSAAKENALLVSAAKSLQVECFQGDEANVLDRFSKAAQKYNADIVVRITGDCPLVDSTLLDNMLDNFSRLIVITLLMDSANVPRWDGYRNI